MTQQQQNLIEKLSKHPDIEARIVEIFSVVGDSSGNFDSPDAAEEFLIKEIRKLGQELLKGWAVDQADSLVAEVGSKIGTIKHSKKKLSWFSTFGKVELLEQCFLYDNKLVRPFSFVYRLSNRCYSMPLQRVVVDFAADESLEKSCKKIKEHYLLDIPKSSARKITLKHAQKMKTLKKEIQKFDKRQAIVDYIISEADGTMTPIVIIDENAPDKRKGKTLIWREARLSFAYQKGSIQPVYEASYGTMDEVGKQIAYCVDAAGKNEYSKIHFVGDGAPWITEQVEKRFGDDASYLIDYYHLSQYLAKASECCSPSNWESWRKYMQTSMKEGKLRRVLESLKVHTDESSDNHECHAKKCYNYIIRRLNQFNYKEAIDQGLPIGSGRVESGHRNVIQKRLKVPGAWWKEENADAMLALRVIRENGFWEQYWTEHATKN